MCDYRRCAAAQFAESIRFDRLCHCCRCAAQRRQGVRRQGTIALLSALWPQWPQPLVGNAHRIRAGRHPSNRPANERRPLVARLSSPVDRLGDLAEAAQCAAWLDGFAHCAAGIGVGRVGEHRVGFAHALHRRAADKVLPCPAFPCPALPCTCAALYLHESLAQRTRALLSTCTDYSAWMGAGGLS